MLPGEAERNPDADRDRGEPGPRWALDEKESAKRAAVQLDEIHQYLSDHYARRDIIAQTRTPGGIELDWVPIESQAGADAAAEPPDAGRRFDFGADEESVRFELEYEDAEVGPPGTVPLVRHRIEDVRSTVGLNDWLAKGLRANVVAPPDVPPEIPRQRGTHKYASTRQSVRCYGTEGNINVWDPFVEWSDEFSLGQLALSRASGGAQQTLEVGAQTYREIYGDWKPHLFVFYTTNDYTQHGHRLGGYNQNVDGWVQVSNTIHPGALLTPSQLGGRQYVMPLKVQRKIARWWVQVAGTWIGYYPASLYSPNGLRSQADTVNWYGEIVDSTVHAGTTRTDMGNGHWPEAGFGQCAYMNNLKYQSSLGGRMSAYNGGSGSESDPACYGLVMGSDEPRSWGSYFWWGGSGRNPGCP